MFSQKKKNYRNWIWVAIACTAVALVIFLLLGYLGRNNDEPYTRTNGDERVRTENFDFEDEADIEQEVDFDATGEKDKNEQESFQSYYLVKYDKDIIRIYFSDRSGKMTELEETTIIYETLSEADQKRFDKGIKLDSRNALNKLLMDYES